MKVILATLALFLLAFAGLATGLILRRKGLRGGCGHTPEPGHDCRCKTPPAKNAEAAAMGDAEPKNAAESQDIS